MSLRGLFARLYFLSRDLQFRVGRTGLAWSLALAFPVMRVLGRSSKAVSMLLAASRLTDGTRFTALLARNRRLISSVAPTLLPERVALAGFDRRCVVLADPRIEGQRVLRKGVLLVSFTETSGRLYASADVEKLAKLFHIVLEPSWAGYADPSILCWTSYPEPVLVQSSEQRDRAFLVGFGSNLVPVTYGAGDWIQAPQMGLATTGAGRVYDALCVANFGWWKRVHAFVEAVKVATVRHPSYRAALVLAQLAKTPKSAARIEALIGHHGMSDVIDVFEDLKSDALATLYQTSGVLVFPSWKEGSSRVLYEAMGHNLPVIVLSSNVGVNKDYINEETGLLVDDSTLGVALAQIKSDGWVRSPRNWFLGHLGPENTTKKLVEDLRRVFPEEGWTEADVLVKANIPEARIRHPTVDARTLSQWLNLPLG